MRTGSFLLRSFRTRAKRPQQETKRIAAAIPNDCSRGESESYSQEMSLYGPVPEGFEEFYNMSSYNIHLVIYSTKGGGECSRGVAAAQLVDANLTYYTLLI